MKSSLSPKIVIIFAVGVLISLVFIYFSLAGINYDKLTDAFVAIDVFYFSLCLVFILLSYLTRSVLWKFLLKPVQNVGTYSAFKAILVGYMFNNIFPFRVGEFARAFHLGKSENLPFVTVLSSIIAERFLDIISLAIIAFISFFILLDQQFEVQNTTLFAIIVVVMFFCMAFFVWQQDRLPFATLFQKVFPKTFVAKLEKIYSSFSAGLKTLGNLKSLVTAFILVLVTWLCMTLAVGFLMKAMNIDISILVGGIVLMTSANLVLLIPSSPGGIGTFHYSCIFALSLFGVQNEVGLAYGVVLHVAYLVISIIFGFTFLVSNPIKYAQLLSLKTTSETSK